MASVQADHIAHTVSRNGTPDLGLSRKRQHSRTGHTPPQPLTPALQPSAMPRKRKRANGGAQNHTETVRTHAKASVLVDGDRFPLVAEHERFDRDHLMFTSSGKEGGSNTLYASTTVQLTGRFRRRIYFLCMFFYKQNLPREVHRIILNHCCDVRREIICISYRRLWAEYRIKAQNPVIYIHVHIYGYEITPETKSQLEEAERQRALCWDRLKPFHR